MKKFFGTLFAAIFSLTATAQNELAVVPAEASSAGTYVYLDLNNQETANKVIVMEIDIVWPNGWTIGAPSISHSAVRERYADWNEDDEAWVTPWSVKGALQADGVTTKYVFSGGNTRPLSGSKGHIARIKITPAEGTAAGVYPIKVSNTSYIACSGDKGSEIWTGTQTSYVTVGTPSTFSLPVEGVLPSFVTSALPADATIDLTESTAIYGSNANNVTVKYNRTVSNEWNTICLPVDAKSDANIQYYTVSKIGSDALEVAGVSTLAAGTPALAKVTGSAINISATSALSTTLKNGGNLIGTFEPINVTDADAYYIKNNKFYQCNGNFNVAAFKAYIKKAASGAKAILDITESDATAINAICGEGEVTVDAIYGVNGARQNDLKKGINIVTLSNGATKKIIVK